MKLAISTPNSYIFIAGTTSKTDFRDRLIAILIGSEWEVVATISGGTRLLGVSPQGLAVYVDIYVTGSAGVFIQFSSAIGSGKVGANHFLEWSPPLRWQMCVHKCGFAISWPGFPSQPAGSTVIGGIPFIGENCGVTGGTTDECWFSFGDAYGDPFSPASNPRIGLDVNNRHDHANVACHNGVLSPIAPTNQYNGSQILRISSAAPDNESGNSQMLWYPNADILYPPLMAWPDAVDGPILIRGQIYNAFVRSGSLDLDTNFSFDNYDWIVFSDHYFWGSLFLLRSQLRGPPPGRPLIGNYAY
jgi:hypothetical protein